MWLHAGSSGVKIQGFKKFYPKTFHVGQETAVYHVRTLRTVYCTGSDSSSQGGHKNLLQTVVEDGILELLYLLEVVLIF